MGIFQQRPEEPTEWAGLPSEPWEPTSPVERLGDAPPTDIPLFGPIPRAATIAIAIEPTAPADPPADADDG